MKTKLPHYNASIVWDDEPTAPSANGTVTLPDSTTAVITRHSQQSAWRTAGGQFTTGGSHYTIGDSRFESFDDAMQKGLGLTKMS